MWDNMVMWGCCGLVRVNAAAASAGALSCVHSASHRTSLVMMVWMVRRSCSPSFCVLTLMKAQANSRRRVFQLCQVSGWNVWTSVCSRMMAVRVGAEVGAVSAEAMGRFRERSLC